MSVTRPVVRYADREVLQSGWLIGEQTQAGKAAKVSAQYGEGRVILIGFRPPAPRPGTRHL